jgi:glycolate oxidase
VNVDAALPREWLRRAAAIVGEGNLVTGTDALQPYSHDEYPLSTYARIPEAVVRPGNEEEVAGIVRLCAETGVPVTPVGARTGLAGGCIPAPGGIGLSVERLTRVLDMDRVNHTITLEAGVALKVLYEAADSMGLFFPPHPGEEGATIGGAVAANAGGARTVKYGTVKRFVQGLRVVLASGQTLELGGKYQKSSSGYSLLPLFIGSEGTLGVITSVTLALVPRPGVVNTLVAPFASVGAAAAAVTEILASGIVPAAVELVEEVIIAAAETYLKRSWPVKQGAAQLMVILDARTEEDLLQQEELLAEKLAQAGALEILVAESAARQAEILQLRSVMYEALRPQTVEILDVCVPRSEFAAHLELVHALEREHDIPIAVVGHAADGNVHAQILRRRVVAGAFAEEVPNWQSKVALVRDAILLDAKRRGGVISGEHGIGQAKRGLLVLDVGERAVEIMRGIKGVLDPQGIMNPGKVLPPSPG